MAVMASEHAARAVDDVARALVQPAVTREEASRDGAGEEAEVLGLGLVRDCEPGLLGDGADLVLRAIAEREAQPRERAASERGEHVRLVLRGIDGEPQQAVVGAPRVVAGRQRRGAEPVGELEHRIEADVAVAAHAGIRGQAVGVLAQPGIDDPVAKLVAQVEREVRHAEAVREAPGAAHGGRRAAGALGVVVDIGP